MKQKCQNDLNRNGKNCEKGQDNIVSPASETAQHLEAHPSVNDIGGKLGRRYAVILTYLY